MELQKQPHWRERFDERFGIQVDDTHLAIYTTTDGGHCMMCGYPVKGNKALEDIKDFIETEVEKKAIERAIEIVKYQKMKRIGRQLADMDIKYFEYDDVVEVLKTLLPINK